MLKGAVNNLLDCDHGGDDDGYDDVIDNYDDVGDNGDDNYDDNDEGEDGVSARGCCDHGDEPEDEDHMAKR